MLANDLFGPVAFDPLRPGVPGDDVPLRVEQKDGVVPDVSNKLGEFLLGVLKALLSPIASGERPIH